MTSIDLNCDMGELKPGQSANCDADLMPFISSCNIACGGHSGSPELMERTVRLAMAEGVQVGAHPAYMDRENFGRVSLQVERGELMGQVREQVLLLKGMVERMGGRLHHVKAHGALYNDMSADAGLAADYAKTLWEIDPGLQVYCLAGSCVVDACRDLGMVAVNEGFADRRYETAVQLRSRSFADAVLHEWEDLRAQIDGFLRGELCLASGVKSKVLVETICLHSDTPGAVALGKQIHAYLMERDVRITAIL